MKFIYKRVVLIGIKKRNKLKCIKSLEELEFLTKTLDGKIYKKYIQKIKSNILIGSGKVQELNNFIQTNKIDTIIFDYNLSPTQLRNLKKIISAHIVDREKLILDIFLKRANTFYAKTQIKLAKYKYLLPRLRGMWTHLEKQKGGIGIRSGAGESEIETDKRVIKNKIRNLKKKILKIDKQMNNQRKNRKNITKISIIGYTNAGKSTIMNNLTKSQIPTDNKLFMTVDTTVRKMFLNKTYVLMSDTVGFITNLPNKLLESFKSTLNEIKDSNMLLHIVDISNIDFKNQILSVNKILTDIGVSDIPCIVIFNKKDLCDDIKIKHSLQIYNQMLSTNSINYDNKYIKDTIIVSSKNKKY